MITLAWMVLTVLIVAGLAVAIAAFLQASNNLAVVSLSLFGLAGLVAIFIAEAREDR